MSSFSFLFIGLAELIQLSINAPLYVANEGKLVAVVASDDADKVLATMRQNPYAVDASVIGEVTDEYKGRVVMKTRLGASRIVDMLSGELLPRIC